MVNGQFSLAIVSININIYLGGNNIKMRNRLLYFIGWLVFIGISFPIGNKIMEEESQ